MSKIVSLGIKIAFGKGTYFPGRETEILVDAKNSTVSFHDKKTGELLAKHPLAIDVVGKFVQLPKNAGRFCGNNYDTLKNKVLTEFNQAAGYIEQLIEKYPRYAKDQLRIMESCIRKFSEEELKNALDCCVSKDLINANDFRDTLEFFGIDEPKLVPKELFLPEKYQMVCAKVRDIDSYVSSAREGQDL